MVVASGDDHCIEFLSIDHASIILIALASLGVAPAERLQQFCKSALCLQRLGYPGQMAIAQRGNPRFAGQVGNEILPADSNADHTDDHPIVRTRPAGRTQNGVGNEVWNHHPRCGGGGVSQETSSRALL